MVSGSLALMDNRLRSPTAALVRLQASFQFVCALDDAVELSIDRAIGGGISLGQIHFLKFAVGGLDRREGTTADLTLPVLLQNIVAYGDQFFGHGLTLRGIVKRLDQRL